MKTSSRWMIKSVAGKIIMGIVLAAMIGSMEVVTAIAQDGNKGFEKYDRGHNEQRGRGYDRDRYRDRNFRDRRVYRHYGYRERVYYPPPVIYAPPPPPPGIDIFLPPLSVHF